MALLEDVFRLSGIPTHTYVQPEKFDAIKISIRTPGRCLVLEGPSGIGKTTIVTKIIEDLKISQSVLSLTARSRDDIELVSELPGMKDIGIVIVDDFHRLDDKLKQKLADFMKVLADTEDTKSKLVLIGINKAGQNLVRFAHDLGLRIDVFRLEGNPDYKIEDAIALGEKTLNVSITSKGDIVARAGGSFQLAQLLCHKLCVLDSVTESKTAHQTIEKSINVCVEDVMVDLSRLFREAVKTFASGSKLRREGRAPYLHMLKWLSESDDSSVDLDQAITNHPEMKASVTQVLENRYLENLIYDPLKNLDAYFYFDTVTRVLSVEDPRLIFYLRNLIWRVFTREVGFHADFFKGRYDFALSFAGKDRGFARKIKEKLNEREVPCFYDEDEQHRIIARNIEDYLAPIYRSEARYVIVLQSPDYPTRIWTKFESDNFKERFGQGSVIPIRFSSVVPGFFHEDHDYGGLYYHTASDEDRQVDEIVETLCKRLLDDKSSVGNRAG